MSLTDAVTAFYEKQQQVLDDALSERAEATKADRELVDDPFHPGAKCMRFEAETDPRVRFQAAVKRATEAQNTKERRDGEDS